MVNSFEILDMVKEINLGTLLCTAYLGLSSNRTSERLAYAPLNLSSDLRNPHEKTQ